MQRIKLIIFDLWDTLAYRNVRIGSVDYLIGLTGYKGPKDKFAKIFENSVQKRRWKTKHEA
ncbi:MAG: hypothetical protein QW112_02330 [Candidatus Micrarchaeia archaeon]